MEVKNEDCRNDGQREKRRKHRDITGYRPGKGRKKWGLNQQDQPERKDDRPLQWLRSWIGKISSKANPSCCFTVEMLYGMVKFKKKCFRKKSTVQLGNDQPAAGLNIACQDVHFSEHQNIWSISGLFGPKLSGYLYFNALIQEG